jgi:hypothetical protein
MSYVTGLLLLSAVCMTSVARAAEWKLPPDQGTLTQEEVSVILAGNDYPETTTYTRKTDFIDFTAYGQKFTQVVVTLYPARPRMHQGRKLVVVGAEPGSEYAMDFLETAEGKEGMGVWLAKRGVTFVALTRVGRWNFFDGSGNGSWKDIPLGERMPIFNRDQKQYWSRDDYSTQKSETTAVATGGDSAVYRIPKPGTALYNQSLAATPVTVLAGYRKAIEHVLPPAERGRSFVLYWGMSTGGAFLFPLAKQLTPDGYLGWGTSSTGLAYLYRRAKQGDFRLPYTQSALRVRERGFDDFEFYTRHVAADLKQKWWQGALKEPRFKGMEDPPMQFHVAALTETAMRLWLSDFLPAEYRKDGLGKFIQDIIEPSFPPRELKGVAILEMNGTRDEVIPPRTVDAHREVMEPYAGRYRVARFQDFHHYLFTQESIKAVGTVWLKFVESGYFDL